MNIFKQELKMHFRSTMLWMMSQAALIFSFMALYPSFSRDSEAINLVLKNYPKEMLAAFGMSGVDLSTIAGYFAMTFLYIQICIAIQASNHGFSILSVEERERTADFLFTKPVKRSSIIRSKVLASLTNLFATDIIVFAVSLLSIELFKGNKGFDLSLIIKMLSSIVIFQLFFLTVGMVISMLVRKVSSVLPYSMGLSFGMFIISAFGSMVGEHTFVYITPFKHFEPNYLVNNGRYDSVMVAISIFVVITAAAASYFLYLKRNIHSTS